MPPTENYCAKCKHEHHRIINCEEAAHSRLLIAWFQDNTAADQEATVDLAHFLTARHLDQCDPED